MSLRFILTKDESYGFLINKLTHQLAPALHHLLHLSSDHNYSILNCHDYFPFLICYEQLETSFTISTEIVSIMYRY